jgi:hypothetical protein
LPAGRGIVLFNVHTTWKKTKRQKDVLLYACYMERRGKKEKKTHLEPLGKCPIVASKQAARFLHLLQQLLSGQRILGVGWGLQADP